MSNVNIASKSFVFILVVLSSAGFVAGTSMTKEQKEAGMLWFGKVLFGEKEFGPKELKEYQDPLANEYTNMGMPDLANQRPAVQSQIVMSRLPNESGWKIIFPSLSQVDITNGTALSKLFSDEDIPKEILAAFGENKVEKMDVNGFTIELFAIDGKEKQENVPKNSAGLLSLLAAGSLGIMANVRIHQLVATITTRRSKLENIYPAGHGLFHSSRVESDAEKLLDTYATKWANKNSLGIDSTQYPIEDSKKFLRKQIRVSTENLQPLLIKMRDAAERYIGKQKSDIIVRLAYVNIFEINAGQLPQRTDNYVVFLYSEGLISERIKFKILNVDVEKFKYHQFEDYVQHGTDANCQFCQKAFSEPTPEYHCKDCSMLVHKSCAATLPAAESGVPLLLQKCTQFIEEKVEKEINQTEIEGIYRLSGSAPDIEDLFSDFKTGMCMSNNKLWINANKNIHNITDVVKRYLREMPDRLISREIYERIKTAWKHNGKLKATITHNMKEIEEIAKKNLAKIPNNNVDVAEITQNNERIANLTQDNEGITKTIQDNNKQNSMLLDGIINELPQRNKMILKLILKHFNVLLTFSERTKMLAHAYAIVIGQNIFEAALADTMLSNLFAEEIITNFPNFVIAKKEAL